MKFRRGRGLGGAGLRIHATVWYAGDACGAAGFQPCRPERPGGFWAYVAQHHPEAADALELDIREAAEQWVKLPPLGRRNYLRVYRTGEHLEIVRVLHGARDAVHELE